MIIDAAKFNPDTFSFDEDPILVLENFWTPQQILYFRHHLRNSPDWWNEAAKFQEHGYFKGSGAWRRAGQPSDEELKNYQSRLFIKPVATYIDNIPNIKTCHMTMSYYIYAAGDCLPVHDDGSENTGQMPNREGELCTVAKGCLERKIAHISYWNEMWNPGWGGELMIYEGEKNNIRVAACILPRPGTLAMFTVPRLHRIARIEPCAAAQRLSSAGWLTAEFPPQPNKGGAM